MEINIVKSIASKIESDLAAGKTESFCKLLDIVDLEKGKRAQLGEIREWKGKKFQKTGQGWVPVKAGGQGKEKEEPDKHAERKDIYSVISERLGGGEKIPTFSQEEFNKLATNYDAPYAAISDLAWRVMKSGKTDFKVGEEQYFVDGELDSPQSGYSRLYKVTDSETHKTDLQGFLFSEKEIELLKEAAKMIGEEKKRGIALTKDEFSNIAKRYGGNEDVARSEVAQEALKKGRDKFVIGNDLLYIDREGNSIYLRDSAGRKFNSGDLLSGAQLAAARTDSKERGEKAKRNPFSEMSISSLGAIIEGDEDEIRESKIDAKTAKFLQDHAKFLDAGGGHDGDGSSADEFLKEQGVNVKGLFDEDGNALFDEGELPLSVAKRIGRALGMKNVKGGAAYYKSGFESPAFVIFDETSDITDKIIDGVEGEY